MTSPKLQERSKKPKVGATAKTANAQPDILRLEYVPLDTMLQWERNAKKHDDGSIWASIEKHGMKDPAKFEPLLNGGKGGIVEGNGRSHVLRSMQAAGNKPPRGVIENADGVWLVPILFGVDAQSEKAAEAYGIDHNNITMLGGDYSLFDISKLWNEKPYTELLADLAAADTLPVSVDGDDIDALIESYARGGESQEAEGEKKAANLIPEKDGYHEQFGVIVICEGEAEQKEVFERLQEEGYQCKVVTT